MSRDVMVLACDGTTESHMSDIQDHLLNVGAEPIATLGTYVLLVAGDVDSIRTTLTEAQEAGMGVWAVIETPEQIPDWGDEFATYFEAWRLTHEVELVVAENGDRPDENLYFEGLAGCHQ